MESSIRVPWQTRLDSALAAVEAAPFARERWYNALELLAPLLGGNASQIIGWSGGSDVPVHTTLNITPKEFGLWLDLGGADPGKNPLVRQGVKTPEMKVVSDEEIISSSAQRMHPLWAEFYSLVDIPHFAFVHLQRDRQSFLTLGVMHNKAHGPISKEERQLLGQVSQKWQSSIILSRSIGTNGGALIKGALDVVGVAALILDGFGRVVGITKQAEAMARGLMPFTIIAGELRFAAFGKDKAIKTLIKFCLSQRSQGSISLSIPGNDGNLRAYNFNVSFLPNELNDIGLGAAAVMIIDEIKQHPGEAMRKWLERTLTHSEYAIAMDLAAGNRLNDVAVRRRVSIQTIRSQAKAIYSKSGSSGQIELMARFSTALSAHQSLILKP